MANENWEENPEGMRDFFAARVDDYDAHMHGIEGLDEAYARLAALLPAGARSLLDLGCGTGLELVPVFDRFPALEVTGIDLTQEMLEVLTARFAGRSLRLICGDYLRHDLGGALFDAAVSAESLHHFSHAQKRALYRRIGLALRPGGVYIEADFIALSQDEEDTLYAKRASALRDAGRQDGLWHLDTPCTAQNQLRLLREAGFSRVALEGRWGQTALFVAETFAP